MIVWMKSDSVAIQLHSTDLCVLLILGGKGLTVSFHVNSA